MLFDGLANLSAPHAHAPDETPQRPTLTRLGDLYGTGFSLYNIKRPDHLFGGHSLHDAMELVPQS